MNTKLESIMIIAAVFIAFIFVLPILNAIDEYYDLLKETEEESQAVKLEAAKKAEREARAQEEKEEQTCKDVALWLRWNAMIDEYDLEQAKDSQRRTVSFD